VVKKLDLGNFMS